MTKRLPRVLLAACFVLAACDAEAPAVADDTGRAATGDVLEGSISDEMLPVESLSSQPPVAAPLPSEASSDGPADDDEPGERVTAPSAPDAAEPAPEPEAPASETDTP